METRVDKVAENHKSGYNCAQAVACGGQAGQRHP